MSPGAHTKTAPEDRISMPQRVAYGAGAFVNNLLAAASGGMIAKGKGNKLINIPAKKYKEGEEKLVAMAVIPEEGNLQVHTGTRMMTLKWDDLDAYYGERALRGRMLPKVWRKVERLSTET